MEELEKTYKSREIWNIEGHLFKNPLIAARLDKLTYGLLYPAFFGNMIYDLLLAFQTKDNGRPNVAPGDFCLLLVIIGFNVVDFLHLYVDVDKSINGKILLKTHAYIYCDMATAIMLFGAFVLVKNDFTAIGTFLFCLVPLVIGRYKRTYNWNMKDLARIKRFELIAVISLIVTATVWFFQTNSMQLIYTGLSLILLTFYVHYTFYTYPSFRDEKVGSIESKKQIEN
jgi:hypothetical protein